MKRRLLLGGLMLALVMMVMPVVAAQDSKAVWDLTESIKVTDLGLDIKYPSGWTYQATDTNGIFIAENKADFDAVMDTDPTTLATGSTIQLIATKIVNLKDAVGEDATLDDVADFVVKSRGVTEKEKRVDVPVMTRHARVALGEDEAKQGWILAIWQQGEYYMGAFIASPDYTETLRLAYSFGQLLGSINPLDALALSKDNTMSLDKIESVLNYPDGWFHTDAQPGVVFELKSDIENKASEGLSVHFATLTMADAKLKDDAAVTDVIDAIIANLGMKEPVTREEFILLGQPAITIRGEIASGQYVLSTQAIVNGLVLQIAVLGPSEEKVTAFEPTFISILQSLRSTKTS
ncbi:MAG: hypothetical protein H0X30_35250 [Anaerolineae bacterium]|nr:hypothetical protein [Anaerolineae bacterium]